MGMWDYNNYVLKVQLHENLTDSRFIEFVTRWDYTIDDFFSFQESIEPLTNEVAQKIMQFFVSYNKIDLCPDNYNRYEPVKLPFNKDDFYDSVHILAFPSGTLHLKKKRRFQVMIENLWYFLTFDPDDNHKVMIPLREISEDEYLGCIQIYISKNTKFYSMNVLQEIIEDLCTYLQTDYGVIIDQETNEVLYQYKPAQ